MTTLPRHSLLHLNKDSIIAKYGLEALRNIGVIDLQSGQPVNEDFILTPGTTRIKSREETAKSIHPVFARDRWALDSQDDWQVLEPVLRLASCGNESLCKMAVRRLRRKTKASVIKVNRNYLKVLKGQIKSTEYVKAENFDQAAALLRTRMHMAMIVCHEFTHALHNATWEREDDEWAPTLSTTTPLPPEPFFRDDRISELGWAFQQYAFGGLLRPIGYFQPDSADAAFPYGFFLEHFPGAVKKEDEHMRKFQQATPFQLGVTTILRHGVHMSYVQKQFTKEFWNKTVLLSGSHLRVQDHDKVAFVEDVVW
ncbi:hypothetical protein BDV97DRAFT_369023 [Delphinella strobiligena]|nr:hypothetical protein BDV97DRAFT_369023 [Delphinella strobiligena]